MDSAYRIIPWWLNKSIHQRVHFTQKKGATNTMNICDEFAVSVMGLLLCRSNREELFKFLCCVWASQGVMLSLSFCLWTLVYLQC